MGAILKLEQQRTILSSTHRYRCKHCLESIRTARAKSLRDIFSISGSEKVEAIDFRLDDDLRDTVKFEFDPEDYAMQASFARLSRLIKRLGKWSVLFTVGTTFFISDCIAALLDQIQGVEEFTTSFLYRYPVGLFVPAPSPNVSLIAMWKIIDLVQMIFFLGLVIICIRWAYADIRASEKPLIQFPTLMGIAFVTNFAIYFTLRHFAHL